MGNRKWEMGIGKCLKRSTHRRGRREEIIIMSIELCKINLQHFAKKGREIYERLQKSLEAQYLGKIVAIDVETGEYFLGDTVIDAGKKGREKYPKKVFHFIRVGFPAVHVRR
jgi:hypothetical protein